MLYLLLQLPIDNTSSLVVLEGNYTDSNYLSVHTDKYDKKNAIIFMDMSTIVANETNNGKVKGITYSRNAKMSEIYTDDKNRIELIKWVTNFIKEYKKGNTTKGLYLSGNFGSGKSYIVSACLNELVKDGYTNAEIRPGGQFRPLLCGGL